MKIFHLEFLSHGPTQKTIPVKLFKPSLDDTNSIECLATVNGPLKDENKTSIPQKIIENTNLKYEILL